MHFLFSRVDICNNQDQGKVRDQWRLPPVPPVLSGSNENPTKGRYCDKGTLYKQKITSRLLTNIIVNKATRVSKTT